MNKKIIAGSLFAGLVLMLVPSIPAVEYNTVTGNHQVQLLEHLSTIAGNYEKKILDTLHKGKAAQFIKKIDLNSLRNEIRERLDGGVLPLPGIILFILFLQSYVVLLMLFRVLPDGLLTYMTIVFIASIYTLGKILYGWTFADPEPI